MTETLKPCPFCGDKAVLKEELRWHGAFRVVCSSCDATVWATGANNPASAIAHWNRRAAPREPGRDMVRLTDVMARIAEASLRYGGTQESWLVGPRQLTEDIRALAAPRPDAGEPGEACPDCGYDVLVTDPDLRDPVEARVHAIDCPRTRYVVEYGVEAPPTVRHVRPHRSGCGHYDCSVPRPDAGDGRPDGAATS